MAPSKIRRALGAVKDQTSIGLAKVGNSTSLSDLEVAIVKATRHEETPAEERHIREILSLTSYARAYVSACVNNLARRLNKTKNWTVALKTLILIQRLLVEGDPAYEQEIFFATRRGTRLLNLSDFRDKSNSNSWDYSAFVRTYALYLDEKLEYKMQGRRGKRSMFGFVDEDEEDPMALAVAGPGAGAGAGAVVCVRTTPLRDMKTERIFSRVQHLQQLLERFLACRPTGGARHNRVVIVALYPVVKESFQYYSEITEILGILIDRFMELEIQDSVKVYDIFCRVSKQLDELDSFYCWTKSIGIARSSEYPDIEKITQKKLDLMDDFIRDKSVLAQTQPTSPRGTEEMDERKENDETDMNAIKALPAPEEVTEAPVVEVKEEPKEEEENKQLVVTQQEGDLLNLGDYAVSSEEHANQLALALFDGEPAAASNTAAGPTWEAFSDDTADWETALIQSASNLSGGHRASLPGGFNMMLLDGMYKQGTTAAAMSGVGLGASGSASSVALGSAGRPAMLALPAPPTPDGRATTSGNVDPFAASLAVAPPAYVQMSEMEKKQKLLMDEQMMWQQYARDGMHGQVGLAKLQQPNAYTMHGGYTRGY